MQITRCVLDGKQLQTTDDVYDQLAIQLSLPRYFGRNLDALWDVLTVDIAGPVELTWNHADVSRKRLGKGFISFKRLLEEAADERDDLTVRFVEDDPA